MLFLGKSKIVTVHRIKIEWTDSFILFIFKFKQYKNVNMVKLDCMKISGIETIFKTMATDYHHKSAERESRPFP